MANKETNYNVLFFPDKEKTAERKENSIIVIDAKNGKEKYYNYDAKLRVRIRWHAGVLDNKFIERDEVLNFNLGERVELAKWSTDAQRCNAGTTHGKKKRTAKDINTKIQKVSDKIDEIFSEFAAKNISPTVSQFRSRYNNQSEQPIKEKTLLDYFDEFVAKESSQNNWKNTTIGKFKGKRNHLEAFGKHKKNYSFDYFSKDGLNAYVGYLRDDKGMRNISIKKQISILKWFFKWAKNEGYKVNDAFLTFAPKMPKDDKKVIFLDWNELISVYNFDLSTVKNKDAEGIKALERVRDVFCFCCFSGLRYSDVENLKRTNIINGSLEITTVKTGDPLKIELNNYTKAILAKYANEVYPENKALPVISNQKMNEHLKALGEICGLNTPITITYHKGAQRFDEVYPKYALLTTHCGRRTFICNALTLGIAPTTVMKWTGHSDYKSMQPYIDVADKEKEKAMNLFNR